MTREQEKRLEGLIRSAIGSIELNDNIHGNEEHVDAARIDLEEALTIITEN